LEIVSRPEIHSAEHAKAYVSELRAIVVATGAADGKLEEGSMRVDANVSVRRPGEPLGTRAEIKNVNSLRSLVRAIDYEATRQIDLILNGERIVQETRHWNEADGRTSSMRSKEEAMDYRYFPEPDLVPLAPSAEWVASVRAALPQLPADRRAALAAVTNGELTASADPIVTIVDQGLDDFVLASVAAGADARKAINRTANEIVTPENAARISVPMFAKLLTMESAGTLTATQAKQVLAEMLETGEGDPADIATARGFEAVDASVIETLVDELIAAHPAEFERMKAGDGRVAGFFVGAAMKASGGKADGKAVTAVLRSRAGL
jgi:aspartyl-tRNA(Asn)/glutamyl-tRNA(Gln) amidotransferase subunit B